MSLSPTLQTAITATVSVLRHVYSGECKSLAACLAKIAEIRDGLAPADQQLVRMRAADVCREIRECEERIAALQLELQPLSNLCTHEATPDDCAHCGANLFEG